MMRGFAGSGGVFNPHGCDVGADGLSQARDIAAVIGYMAKKPNVDASRIIMSGQSFGGWNTLAFATLGYPGVRGVLNFSGGIRQPECPYWESNLISAAGRYGARTRIPSLWFYGDNDSLFAATTWHGMYENYVQHGGPATLIAYGTFMNDAHNMLGSLEGFSIWMSKVDAFLAGLGLPSKLIDARYLPATFPPPSHFAAIDDVNAVPYQGDKGRQEYRVFLTKSFPRVFIVAPMGLGARFDVGYDPLTRGMEACRKLAPNAQLYAVDDQVVWNPTDASKAIEGYEQAAAKGDAVSMFQLARAYETGLGVVKDNSQTLNWLQKAANAGLAMAQNDLANGYKSGHGVPKDYALAFFWYQKAAGQGYAAAQANLGLLYQAGLGITQDYAQAIAWYQKAAEQKEGPAENNLGYMYLKGLGVNRDYSQALFWFKRAADDGIVSAQNEIGNMYANGLGVPKDYEEAVGWYEKAADRGFKTAEYSLGYMFQHGLGVSADDNEAVQWYQKASAQGFEPAARALSVIKALPPPTPPPATMAP
jgi:TPR repeat protein